MAASRSSASVARRPSDSASSSCAFLFVDWERKKSTRMEKEDLVQRRDVIQRLYT